MNQLDAYGAGIRVVFDGIRFVGGEKPYPDGAVLCDGTRDGSFDE
jgi:hypothetical protein